MGESPRPPALPSLSRSSLALLSQLSLSQCYPCLWPLPVFPARPSLVYPIPSLPVVWCWLPAGCPSSASLLSVSPLLELVPSSASAFSVSGNTANFLLQINKLHTRAVISTSLVHHFTLGIPLIPYSGTGHCLL